jgi:hypothetical protein
VDEGEEVRAALDGLKESRDAWNALGPGVQGEVYRLALQGQHHPNLRVAATAYRWACTVVDPDEDESGEARRRGYRSAASGALVNATINLLLGSYASSRQGDTYEQQIAKPIVGIGPPRLVGNQRPGDVSIPVQSPAQPEEPVTFGEAVGALVQMPALLVTLAWVALLVLSLVGRNPFGLAVDLVVVGFLIQAGYRQVRRVREGAPEVTEPRLRMILWTLLTVVGIVGLRILH